MDEAYIVAATRTAGGPRGGRLKDWHPIDLAAHVLAARSHSVTPSARRARS
jgi:acetyl-CoA C-acetyltransferase